MGERFGYLPSLTVLRLNDNNIQCMLKQSFTKMTALEYLDISQNAMETFNISLKYLPKLKMLNISNNHISVLSLQTIHEIDSLISVNISIDLGRNNLLCNCETLTVLKWFKNCRTHFVDFDKYKCTVMNNSLVYLHTLDFIIFDLDRECASHTVLISVCSMALTLCFSLLVSALAYRYRWKLRYFYYMTRLQIKSGRSNGEYEELFDYDAFISYSSDDFEVARVTAIDKLEGEKGLRLCIHEREFQPGESIAYNISKGIHGSKRTLLFLSRAFIASEWCTYELNIARMESLYTERTVILVIMLEDIPAKELSLEMMDYIKTYTCL